MSINKDEQYEELLKSIDESIKKYKIEAKEQEEREKLDPPDRIRLTTEETGAIYWVIHTKEVWIKGEKDPFVELSWGWTAGLSKEQIDNLADDCPKGHNGLILSKELAIDLRDKLNEWLK